MNNKKQFPLTPPEKDFKKFIEKLNKTFSSKEFPLNFSPSFSVKDMLEVINKEKDNENI